MDLKSGNVHKTAIKPLDVKALETQSFNAWFKDEKTVKNRHSGQLFAMIIPKENDRCVTSNEAMRKNSE